MPIIVKPIKDLNSSPVSVPIDRRSDGFDPLLRYQMIPVGQSREMVVQTGDFKAEMDLMTPNISSMSNFRILSQRQPNVFPLPGPGVAVRRIALPERSVIQFTLAGRAIGATALEGRDRPGLGVPVLKPDLRLLISVKGSVTRRVAVCYVFDRIHRDRGVRDDFAAHFQEVNNIFQEQANFAIDNVDGPAASTSAARKITLPGTIGKTFDLTDKKLRRRLVEGFDAAFPGEFDRLHAVVFVIPAPLRIKSLPAVRIAGMGFQAEEKGTGRKVKMILLGPQVIPKPPTRGGPVPSLARRLRHTLAHELGHTLGLRHDPGEEKDLPPVLRDKEINPVFAEPVFHNLMFFDTFLLSDRLNGAQVEILHAQRPSSRDFEF